MGEIFTVADIRRDSGWREALEEKQAYESRRREIEEERERKARAAAEKQQPAVTNDWDAWYAAIDARIKFWFDHYFDGLGAGNDYRGLYADEIAKGLAEIRRVRDDFGRALGELREEFEAKLAALEQHLASNNQAVDGHIEAALARERDVLTEATAQLRVQLRDAIGEMIDSWGTQLAALEQRLRAAPGTLPAVKVYCPDTVHYAGHLVVHQGATYQALRDTARAPPHVDDWVCIASAGRDDQGVRVRGAFNATANYKRFDIVSLDGTAFIARRDSPGVPGISEDGWQLVSRSGRRGPAGEVGPRGRKGERGARGEDGREIVSWHLERKTYRAFPVYQDGRMGPELNLRGLFEQYCEETSHAAE